MKSLLFFARYPLGYNLRDGMAQRIAAIDYEFRKYKRIYLCLTNNIKKEVITIDDNITMYILNPVIHRSMIIKFISQSEFQYVHSLYNASRLLFFFKYCDNLILDVHGVVPEETKLQGHKIKAIIYNYIERKIFMHLNAVITVSDAMTKHFQLKYKNANIRNYITKTIYPSNVFFESDEDKEFSIRRQLNIHHDDIIFIYSGNTQKWQNIDLMLDCISKMNNPKYFFIILTQNIDEFKGRIKSLNNTRLYIGSVNPSELRYYYSISNYGFVLRDDIIVNQVAAPTKIIEYLNYGIIPIVKSENIGDWKNLGYEYVSIYSDLNNLIQKKSNRNKGLAHSVFEKSNGIDLNSLI